MTNALAENIPSPARRPSDRQARRLTDLQASLGTVMVDICRLQEAVRDIIGDNQIRDAMQAHSREQEVMLAWAARAKEQIDATKSTVDAILMASRVQRRDIDAQTIRIEALERSDG